MAAVRVRRRVFPPRPHNILSSCSSHIFRLDRHFRPPYAVVRLEDGKYSVPGRVYDVSVEASVPVNDNNLELGSSDCVPPMLGLRIVLQCLTLCGGRDSRLTLKDIRQATSWLR